MKKLLVWIMTLALVAVLPMAAFAAEDVICPSPPILLWSFFDFDSYHPGVRVDVSEETVAVGSEISFTAPESEYAFLGFTAEGEYEIVSGGDLILDEAPMATRSTNKTIVLIANSDLSVVVHYDISAEEETTEENEPTTEDDETGDSPDTGDSALTFWLMAMVAVGLFGCVLAVGKLSGKDEASLFQTFYTRAN